MQFIDIILLAGIAGFLLYRLRSVLGRRTGHQEPPPGPAPAGQGRTEPENVITLPGRTPRIESPEPDDDIGRGVARIRGADPTFDPNGFVGGAKSAFAMIVDAFARGDTATLRPLLDDELYDEFSRAIRERLGANQVLRKDIQDIRDAEITEAELEGSTALVTVRFVSTQTNATYDESGDVVEGDPDQVDEVIDLWSFSRNTRSTDPNWRLVATATED